MTISRFNPKSFLIVLLASAPFFISCKDKETVVETPNTVQEATLEQKKQALQNVAPTSSQTINSSSTGGDLALNPPHGQPGHDCAVPVGAPLNGSGNSSTSPVLNKTNSVPPTISGNGINPPHGQPGHRCDIKVGDPL